jgi:uncharacterized protein YqcC (DUF446 family)
MAHKEELLAKLDEIEAEMKAIGFWSENPPDLQAKIARGEIKSFLDAPSFEIWLQCVFLPNARRAALTGEIPRKSRAGIMATRQYDYNGKEPKAHRLTQLLLEFDKVMVQAADNIFHVHHYPSKSRGTEQSGT